MAFVSAAVGRVTSINLAEFGAALLAYPRCMAPSDTLQVGSRPSAAGALVQAFHLVDPFVQERCAALLSLQIGVWLGACCKAHVRRNLKLVRAVED